MDISQLTFETILTEESLDGQLLTITLNSPPANILTALMMKEIRDCFSQDKNNQNRKLIVIKGNGQNFSFGASVEEHTAERVRDMLPGFHQMIGDILCHPVATLAEVSGFCLGGGFELALACSFIFADEKAKFAVPEIQLGVFPPVAAALLPLLGGCSLTNQMLLSGQKLNASELHSCGVVTQVSAQSELAQNVSTYIEQKLLCHSASSLRFAHQAARLTLVNHYQATIAVLEDLYLNELMSSFDANEGINSFIEKRKPEWRNQ